MKSSSLKVGVIGCGNISDAYFKGCKNFPILEIVHCADIIPERAAAKAAEHGILRHGTPEQLLADPEVQIVVNLTLPRAHAAVNLAALAAGKHIYCEKPFAITRKEGFPVLEKAREKGLLVASAPDTFLGEAHQTCRKLIDDGVIGQPVAATAFMVCHGHESWHPSPAFYYDIGGGPMFDMGPYYLTALVNLMGPMKRVCGSTRITFPQRTITSEPLKGTAIDVKTPTHLAGTLDFQNGATANVIMSFDVWAHHLPFIEIYGTEGSLAVPDPNQTGGTVLVRRKDQREWRDIAHTHAAMPHRGAAVADLAHAIREGRAPRACGDMAAHVVDAMQAFEESSCQGRHVLLTSTCCQPAALSPGLEKGAIG